MKKLLLTLFCLLVCSSNANASSFTLSSYEDAYLYNGDFLNNNYLTVLNFLDRRGYPFIKFNATPELQAALVNESITSVTLDLYVHAIQGTNPPDLNVYYSNNDNWSETQVTMPVPVLTNKIANFTPSQELAYTSVGLDITPFLTDNNGFYSLFLNNDTPLSLTRLTSKEYLGGVSAPFAPKLHIETAPSPVPEPSSLILGLLGITGILGKRKCKKMLITNK